MAITKKKFETFDIDYVTVIADVNYYITGQVVVRLADDKIYNLTVTMYDAPENDRNRKVVANLNYNEVSGDGMMNDNPMSCYLNVNATDELMQYFNNEIVEVIKAELFGEEE